MKLFGKKEYKCGICGAILDSQDKLTEHGQVHVPMTVNQ
jgi:hypothetical protein